MKPASCFLVLESQGEEDDRVGEDEEEEGDMAAMSSELRQRRPYVEPESESLQEEEEGEKGEAGGGGGARKSAGPGWVGAFVFLMIARYYSASYNIIHDCDEVFNYWEPLHYLLYKSGFQTWEYRFFSSLLFSPLSSFVEEEETLELWLLLPREDRCLTEQEQENSMQYRLVCV